MDQVEPEANRARSSRAWFSASIEEFRRTDAETILGHIAKYAEYDVVLTQRNTWLAQIEILRGALSELNGDIFFEFTVPRLGRRIDVVLLIGATVFAIEFKVGEHDFKRSALDQVWDYALDLKNFHEASHAVFVVPILIATEARSLPLAIYRDDDGTPGGYCRDSGTFTRKSHRSDQLGDSTISSDPYDRRSSSIALCAALR